MMKVDAYINLNKDCVSLRSRETEDYGKVVAHRPKAHVHNAEFVVQPSGQKRCRDEGRKNVHAFVRGEWNDGEKIHTGDIVVYNPYEYDNFVEQETERPVESADHTIVSAKGHVIAKGLRYLDS